MKLTETRPEKNVWIIEDDQALGNLLCEEIQDAGLDARWMPSAEKAMQAMEEALPDLIVCDLKLPGMDGLTFLKKVRNQDLEFFPGFLIITAFGTISRAVEALKAGADDFLAKPLDLEHFILAVHRTLERKHLSKTIARMQGFLSSEGFHGIYGQSAPMQYLFDQIRQVARARGPVLILGESGTGKELVAGAVHKESERADGPFLPINCAGIPENLMETELFGHAQGAFTGAGKSRRGIFVEAGGGSLLLDEISEMPLFLQAKLLRVLQDGKLRRVGENVEDQVDVRILAATHRNIEEEVRSGQFREDLFFRLETFTLKIPPLRERGEDIEILADRFLQQFSLGLGKTVKGFSSRALDLMLQYPFPGNVRELRNAVERAVTFTTGNHVRVAHLPARIRKHAMKAEPSLSDEFAFMAENETIAPLDEIERRYMQHVLNRVGGNKRRAAALLGIGRRTLYRRLGDDPSGSTD
ncbi:MAG: sigma-54-dependent transcriptional regulator [Desulfotignum sp.]|nr:sigma-54 dependent transcriptional regulator [Desulfobacteraceae bacterium]